MREKHTFVFSSAPIKNRKELLKLTIESPKNASTDSTPVHITFLDWDELLSYYKDIYLRDWSSVDDTNSSISHSDLSWIPDNVTWIPVSTYYEDDVSEKESDEAVHLDDVSKHFADVLDFPVKNRVKRATRRRNHWIKDKLHAQKVCKILKNKKEKELHDFSIVPAFDWDVPILTLVWKNKRHKKSMQEKFDKFFKAHVHAVRDTSTMVLVNGSKEKTSASETNSVSEHKTYVNFNASIKSRKFQNVRRNQKWMCTRTPIVQAKCDQRMFDPLHLKHGYGFGLLYRYF